MSEPDVITIRGAKEHNLKNVSLEIPKKKLVVFTGVSGSGKSSLAFDTLYAEGQRRYVESLSAYARQFLGQMEKPKYDTLRGLSPTISIEQKAASNNPRSTVGTVTEVHDYLRVLYASIGLQHCPQCGRKVGKQSAQQIVDEILKSPPGTKVQILAPLVTNRKGEHKDLLTEAQKRGFSRARIDGKLKSLEERIDLDKKSKHDIALIIDRLVLKPEVRTRLTDSVETALREGKGILIVTDEAGALASDRVMSELNACHACGLSFGELTPAAFSFNNPLGMCTDCNGLGTKAEMDPDRIVPDPSRTVRDGAIEPWASGMNKGEGWTAEFVESLAEAFKIPLDVPYAKMGQREKDLLMHGSEGKTFTVKWGEGGRYKMEWEGLVNKLMRSFKTTTSEAMRTYYQKFFSDKPCPTCKGDRLKPESRAVKVHGHSLVELSKQTISEALRFLGSMELTENERKIATELLKEIRSRLSFLVDVGLGYLTLDRTASTLSGGESQRIRLASQMGSELTGVIYILDEPSIGLHQRDNGKLLATLKRLRDLGNSVIVVEHDEETMEEADWIVDFGPGAGELGGQVVSQGTPKQVMADEESLTGAYLSGRKEIEVPQERRKPGKPQILIRGARENNLKDVDVEIPLGVLVAVTGVSGAGKSTLINEILYPALARQLYESREVPGRHKSIQGMEHLDKVIDIDQRPIGRTPRSNPATYTKVFDAIREVFALTQEARTFGYTPGRFSFNIKGGRCEACEGDGVKLVEMHFLADVYVPCEVCQGKRFNEATLRVRYKGKNIAEVLDMSVREAMQHFGAHKDIMRVLQTLEDVGLGYIRLGQSSPTLSGGEAQRIKLARELARVATGRTLYILDEPTTGLHFEDIRKLLLVLNRLVEAGNSVLCIEHNLDVIKSADWVLDLGPEGGSGGGRVLAAGTPEQVAQVPESHTGRYLAHVLQKARRQRVGQRVDTSATLPPPPAPEGRSNRRAAPTA
ncbi:excinuclease ABC subunit UvrA [Stigmatella aurantiaca]|uniref:UvrABC system protein A n=1 Tax=Stigmatella aurantiaca (strain DW4/3-1) TaxID=378806 RepID=Q08PT3_STIAD|nr:excinuclease ABC subunit UvrA [Stigmatella aurantiaca]ADO71132.1 Excinuclease ABC subunit A [Stigmatella aurantiaca DW4/3-1]EAU62491.1 excinuclease ABC, A subunit [Stigmatella aurantiaca DW4/3-1]